MLLAARDLAQIQRRVTIAADGTPTVTDAASGSLWGELSLPTSTADAGSAPRSAPPARWRSRDSDSQFAAGDRITVDGTTWEAVAATRVLRHGHRHVGYDTPLLTVGWLYPLAVQLQEQGGAVVANNVPLAVWQPEERATDMGAYEDLEGDAPLDQAAALSVVNRQVIVAGRRLKIVSAVTEAWSGRVRLRLRQTG